jgi:acetoacetate decarboxylase
VAFLSHGQLYPTVSHLVRQWFPFPLAVVGNELIFQFNFNVITSPIHVDYHNAIVMVPATLGDWEGLYFARVYEGSAQSAMLSIWGREIWGFPKVAADVTVSRDDTAARASMSAAHGCARARVEVEFTDLTSTVQPETRLSVFCRKMIPRSDGRGYDVNRLVLVPVGNPSEHHLAARVIECDIKMDVGGNEIAVPIEDGTTAYWYDQEPGLVLELGRDVHDYTVG